MVRRRVLPFALCPSISPPRSCFLCPTPEPPCSNITSLLFRSHSAAQRGCVLRLARPASRVPRLSRSSPHSRVSRQGVGCVVCGPTDQGTPYSTPTTRSTLPLPPSALLLQLMTPHKLATQYSASPRRHFPPSRPRPPISAILPLPGVSTSSTPASLLLPFRRTRKYMKRHRPCPTAVRYNVYNRPSGPPPDACSPAKKHSFTAPVACLQLRFDAPPPRRHAQLPAWLSSVVRTRG